MIPPTPPENPYRRAAYELLAALSQVSLVAVLDGDGDGDGGVDAYRAAVTDRLDRARVRLAELDAQRDVDRAALAEAFHRHRTGELRARVVDEVAAELSQLDGTTATAVTRLTGLPPAVLEDLGGVDRRAFMRPDDPPDDPRDNPLVRRHDEETP